MSRAPWIFGGGPGSPASGHRCQKDNGAEVAQTVFHAGLRPPKRTPKAATDATVGPQNLALQAGADPGAPSGAPRGHRKAPSAAPQWRARHPVSAGRPACSAHGPGRLEPVRLTPSPVEGYLPAIERPSGSRSAPKKRMAPKPLKPFPCGFEGAAGGAEGAVAAHNLALQAGLRNAGAPSGHRWGTEGAVGCYGQAGKPSRWRRPARNSWVRTTRALFCPPRPPSRGYLRRFRQFAAPLASTRCGPPMSAPCLGERGYCGSAGEWSRAVRRARR